MNLLNFIHPNCEASFIEISCNDGGPNPIFGTLYRHPGHSIPQFNDYLGEFLINFTAKNINLFFSFVTIANVIFITFLFNFTFLIIPVFYGLIENLKFIQALFIEIERTTHTNFPQI